MVNRAEIFTTMYFETRVHKVIEVADAMEAAKKIKDGTAAEYHALHWKSEHGDFYAVSDSFCAYPPFNETALIAKDNEKYYQIESISVVWVDEEKELAEIFKQAEADQPISRSVGLIIDAPKDEVAWFTCGCCGNGFRDNVKKQLAFDQDTGYGICKRCEEYYS